MNSKRKSILTLQLGLTALTSTCLIACGGGGGDSSSSNNNQTQPTAVATAEVFVGDSLVAKLENGTQKTVSFASGGDSTGYGQGHSKKVMFF